MVELKLSASSPENSKFDFDELRFKILHYQNIN